MHRFRLSGVEIFGWDSWPRASFWDLEPRFCAFRNTLPCVVLGIAGSAWVSSCSLTKGLLERDLTISVQKIASSLRDGRDTLPLTIQLDSDIEMELTQTMTKEILRNQVWNLHRGSSSPNHSSSPKPTNLASRSPLSLLRFSALSIAHSVPTTKTFAHK